MRLTQSSDSTSGVFLRAQPDDHPRLSAAQETRAATSAPAHRMILPQEAYRVERSIRARLCACRGKLAAGLHITSCTYIAVLHNSCTARDHQLTRRPCRASGRASPGAHPSLSQGHTAPHASPPARREQGADSYIHTWYVHILCPSHTRLPLHVGASMDRDC